MHKIPIFSIGKFNGQEFNKEDLAKVVENFREFQPAIQPVVKLGHSEEQLYLQILAKKYGFDVKKIKDLKGERLLGVGSVKDLEFDEESGILFAEIDEVPDEFKDYINKTPNRRISPEFYRTNKGFVLRAVSLVDIPANKNLDKVVFEEYDEIKFNECITLTKLKEEIKMEEKVLKLEKEKMELEARLEKANSKIKEYEEKIAKFEEDLKAKDELVMKFSENLRKMKIERKVDELIANGNINKEHRDLAIETLELAKYEEGDENNPALKLLSGLKVVDTKTYSETDVEEGEAKKKKESNEVDEDAELLQKYEELVKNGVDPEIATEQVYGKLLK